MKKQSVLLLFGGESEEHDISILSARNIAAALDTTRYEVHYCYIARDGNEWRLVPSLDQLDGEKLWPLLGEKKFATANNEITIDVILPALHGKNGEDGTVQGLARLLHIPIVGCDIAASAVCADKHLAKQVMQNNNLPVVPWVTLSREDATSFQAVLADRESVEQVVGSGPWFVKPANCGSSVGVSKVMQYDELEKAVRRALQYDDTVLIERAVQGRELEVAVLGNPPHHMASGVGEIVSGADFYDYDDKYAEDSAAQTYVQADLPADAAQQITQIAMSAYAACGCSGLARVDFLLDQDGTVFVNEINTMPGFTNISMYPQLWKAQGVDNQQLLDKLITAAVS